MVGLRGRSLNSLFDTLADWNQQLQCLEDDREGGGLTLPS